MGADGAHGTLDGVGERRGQRVGDQRALARTGDARHHREGADGNAHGDVLEVVGGGAAQRDGSALGAAALLGQLDHARSAQVGTGKRLRRGGNLRRRAGRNHLASALAGTRAHVHHEVGRADGVLVVLHHHDRVAQVAQVAQRGDEAVVVSLVKADARLVEDVEHAHEAGADLRGQADALRLTARKGRGGTLKREIAQAHVHQEAQALHDLLDDARANEALALGQGKALEECQGVPCGHAAHVVDGLVAHRDGKDLGLEAGAVARGAGLFDDERLDALAQLLVVRLGVARHQNVRKAREGRLPARVAPVERAVGDVDLLVAQALDEHRAVGRGDLVPGDVGVVAQVHGNGVEHLRPIVAHVEDVAQGTVADGLVGRAHQVVDVDDAMDAQTVALRARAVGGVEREVTRLQVIDGVAVLGARQGKRVFEQLAGALPFLHEPDGDVALGQARSRLDGLGDAAQRPVLDGDTVDDDLDGVLELLVKRHAFLVVETDDLAVDAHAGKALGTQVLEKLRVLALAAAHDGRQNQRLATRSCLGDLVGDLVGRLALDDTPALRAVRRTDAGVQKSQVVVDFRHRAHGGTGVF